MNFDEEIMAMASSVATAVHNRYKKFVDKADLRQEALAWGYRRREVIEERMNDELTPEEYEVARKRIAWQMLRIAQKYARKEKASVAGYDVTDEAYYERVTIAHLLPFVLASLIEGTPLELTQDMVQDGMPKGTSMPSEGGKLLVSLLDIKKAYTLLDDDDKNILQLRYYQHLTLEQLGIALECSKSTADRKADAALRALQDNIGGESPWQ